MNKLVAFAFLALCIGMVFSQDYIRDYSLRNSNYGEVTPRGAYRGGYRSYGSNNYNRPSRYRSSYGGYGEQGSGSYGRLYNNYRRSSGRQYNDYGRYQGDSGSSRGYGRLGDFYGYTESQALGLDYYS